MLTKKQKLKISKDLPYGYANKIVEILKNKGVKNNDGGYHSAAAVRNVMSTRTNLDIEEAILEYHTEITDRKQSIKNSAKKKLKTA